MKFVDLEDDRIVILADDEESKVRFASADELYVLFAEQGKREQLLVDHRLMQYLPPRVTHDVRGKLPALRYVKTQPWRHQHEATIFSLERTAALLAMGVGAGKSKVACDVAANMTPRARRVLIGAPKSVTPNWPRQIEQHYAHDAQICRPNLKLSVAERANVIRDALAHESQYGDATLFVILNHDSIWRDGMRELLQSIAWDVVVIDESHKICDARTNLAKAYYKLNARKRLCLSGTPFKQMPLDVFGEARFLDPKLFGFSFVKFRDTWGKLDAWGYKFVDVKDRPKFDKTLGKIMYHVDRSVLDLPEAQHIERLVTLSDEAQAAHDELVRGDYAALESGSVSAANAGVAVMKRQEITSGWVKRDDGVIEDIDSAKLDALREDVEALEAHEPFVVFARFTHDIERIKAMLIDMGRAPLEQSGQRSEWELFQFKNRGDCLVVQIDSGSEGIDLTRASINFLYSIGYKLTTYEQMLARTHRPGQSRSVTYVHYIAEQTIDQDVYAALSARRNVIDDLLALYRERMRVA